MMETTMVLYILTRTSHNVLHQLQRLSTVFGKVWLSTYHDTSDSITDTLD